MGVVYVIWRLQGAEHYVTRLDGVSLGLTVSQYLSMAFDAETLEISRDEGEDAPVNPFLDGGSPKEGFDLITIFSGEVRFIY